MAEVSIGSGDTWRVNSLREQSETNQTSVLLSLHLISTSASSELLPACNPPHPADAPSGSPSNPCKGSKWKRSNLGPNRPTSRTIVVLRVLHPRGRKLFGAKCGTNGLTSTEAKLGGVGGGRGTGGVASRASPAGKQ